MLTVPNRAADTVKIRQIRSLNKHLEMCGDISQTPTTTGMTLRLVP